VTEFKENINYFLVEIFNNILAFEQRCLNRFGGNFTINDVHIIEQIGLDGKRKMTDIAEAMGVRLASMTSAADRLERKGCIVRERSAVDRRIVLMSLTQYGRVTFKLHKRFHDRMANKVIEAFTDEELRVLSPALASLNEFFKKADPSMISV